MVQAEEGQGFLLLQFCIKSLPEQEVIDLSCPC